MRTRTLSAALVLFSAASAFSQTAPESLLIGPGDMLSVHIFRESDLDSKLRVKDAGTITLPLIGSVAVAGMPPSEAAAAIAERYRGGHFLNQPQVSVLIEESTTEQASVLGEVARPGAVSLSTPRTLLEVLAAAGGLTKAADRHVTIQHRGAPDATVLVPNDPTAQADTVLVAPGDTVLVPRAGIVYVLGDVARPGGFLMQDDSKLSLLQALTLAAGATKTAAENDARILRKRNGVVTELPLRLKEIEQGKLPDIALKNDDIVYVPFSLTKNFALGASSIASSATSAIIYAVP